MAKVPAFGELGATAKDVLYGGKASGPFQFNQVLAVSSTTADGVQFAVTATKKDAAMDMGLKTTYAAPAYTLVSTINQSGKLGVAATYKELMPGLTLGLAGTLPDAESGKLSVDYAVPHATIKSSVSLTAAPKIDLAVTSGVDKITVGGSTSYDAAKGALTKWNLGVGYAASDYQAAVFMNDANVLTGLYAHSVNPTVTVGSEIAHNLGSKVTTFSAGLSKKFDSGSLFKARLDNTGLVSVLLEQEVRPKTKMGFSAQFDALNVEKAPKLGFAYDLKY